MKVKFKCEQCKIPTQRKSVRIITIDNKKYCSQNCANKDQGVNHEKQQS